MRNNTLASDKIWGRELCDSLAIGAKAGVDSFSLTPNISVPSETMKMVTPVNGLWLVQLVLIN